MDKQAIASAAAAPAVGPYSPALAVGDFVFVSGQIPLDSEGRIVAVIAPDQARKALENVKAQLAAVGLGMDAVVKTTIFVTDMDDFAAVNEVYGEFFAPPYPARSTVEVARLPKDVKVEIEAIAVRG
ncbi:MAG TPA: Rid family detoxifying hydrolase [Thermoleophilia bacterium]|nr:Rid family detoxifying hydrolase [Thermoleophilia bacterium]HQG03306.1 Rid family detoxifying hydrolase [Thermoleophilia bacterium]HQG53915.1 Rid family detoxifying hydrolase [Thermoleophilia bacterium]HQJ97581.1 Rid family detoxifying hydrolase [Thermoleophilia bacterium]